MSIGILRYGGAPVVIFVKSKLIRSRRKKFEVIRGRDHEMRADSVLRNWVWSGFIRANGEILCILNTKDFSIRPYETVFLNYLENSLPPDGTGYFIYYRNVLWESGVVVAIFRNASITPSPISVIFL